MMITCKNFHFMCIIGALLFASINVVATERCQPTSKFLQDLLKTGRYQSRMCNGSCMVVPIEVVPIYKPPKEEDGLGAICIEVTPPCYDLGGLSICPPKNRKCA